MTLIGLIVTLVVVGLILWLINTYIPLDPKIRMILNVVVVIFVVLWLLQALGLLGTLGNVRLRSAVSHGLKRIAAKQLGPPQVFHFSIHLFPISPPI